ncbi:MAG: hypothetical protein JW757_02955 [Anaerolineales bacterium]|nr:hypothetical protein [Anaerolineales bacterium]
MFEKAYPEVASFLIRIVQDQPQADHEGGYRGLIRHIQTDEEFSFTCWQDAENFIKRMFPIETLGNQKGEQNENEG